MKSVLLLAFLGLLLSQSPGCSLLVGNYESDAGQQDGGQQDGACTGGDCSCSNQCGGKCCAEGQVCLAGQCSSCPANQIQCDQICCKTTEYCSNKSCIACQAKNCLNNTSCLAIKNNNQVKLANGFYDLCSPCTGSFLAYCDMETDGGGWTLVARSAKDGGSAILFGWGIDTDTLDNDTVPYSLDVLNRRLPFTQILLGQYSAGKSWGENVYRFDVPDQFPLSFQDREAPLANPFAVKTTCNPAPSFKENWMFRFAGFVSYTKCFFFKDSVGLDKFGLFPYSFWSSDVACDRSGGLEKKQGMIFVR